MKIMAKSQLNRELTNKETKEFGYFTTNYRQMTFPGFLSYGKKDEEFQLEEKPSFQEEYILEECTSSEKDSSKPIGEQWVFYQKLEASDGENFEDLVEDNSINKNSSQGGLMPWRKINQMPSVFADAVKNQSLGFISQPIKTGSGFHLLKLEEKRGPLVKFEEQWETRHILLIPSAIRDVDATKLESEVLRERILMGEDFASLAKEFSEDPGSGSNGGNLEWLPLGATVPEFENVMINSEINVVSEVFESQFGFHFLEVTGKRVEDITDYQIEERAYSILFGRKYDEELENTLRSMRAEAFVEFKDLD